MTAPSIKTRSLGCFMLLPVVVAFFAAVCVAVTSGDGRYAHLVVVAHEAPVLGRSVLVGAGTGGSEYGRQGTPDVVLTERRVQRVHGELSGGGSGWRYRHLTGRASAEIQWPRDDWWTWALWDSAPAPRSDVDESVTLALGPAGQSSTALCAVGGAAEALLEVRLHDGVPLLYRVPSDGRRGRFVVPSIDDMGPVWTQEILEGWVQVQAMALAPGRRRLFSGLPRSESGLSPSIRLGTGSSQGAVAEITLRSLPSLRLGLTTDWKSLDVPPEVEFSRADGLLLGPDVPQFVSLGRAGHWENARLLAPATTPHGLGLRGWVSDPADAWAWIGRSGDGEARVVATPPDGKVVAICNGPAAGRVQGDTDLPADSLLLLGFTRFGLEEITQDGHQEATSWLRLSPSPRPEGFHILRSVSSGRLDQPGASAAVPDCSGSDGGPKSLVVEARVVGESSDVPEGGGAIRSQSGPVKRFRLPVARWAFADPATAPRTVPLMEICVPASDAGDGLVAQIKSFMTGALRAVSPVWSAELKPVVDSTAEPYLAPRLESATAGVTSSPAGLIPPGLATELRPGQRLRVAGHVLEYRSSLLGYERFAAPVLLFLVLLVGALRGAVRLEELIPAPEERRLVAWLGLALGLVFALLWVGCVLSGRLSAHPRLLGVGDFLQRTWFSAGFTAFAGVAVLAVLAKLGRGQIDWAALASGPRLLSICVLGGVLAVAPVAAQVLLAGPSMGVLISSLATGVICVGGALLLRDFDEAVGAACTEIGFGLLAIAAASILDFCAWSLVPGADAWVAVAPVRHQVLLTLIEVLCMGLALFVAGRLIERTASAGGTTLLAQVRARVEDLASRLDSVASAVRDRLRPAPEAAQAVVGPEPAWTRFWAQLVSQPALRKHVALQEIREVLPVIIGLGVLTLVARSAGGRAHNNIEFAFGLGFKPADLAAAFLAWGLARVLFRLGSETQDEGVVEPPSTSPTWASSVVPLVLAVFVLLVGFSTPSLAGSVGAAALASLMLWGLRPALHRWTAEGTNVRHLRTFLLSAAFCLIPLWWVPEGGPVWPVLLVLLAGQLLLPDSKAVRHRQALVVRWGLQFGTLAAAAIYVARDPQRWRVFAAVAVGVVLLEAFLHLAKRLASLLVVVAVLMGVTFFSFTLQGDFGILLILVPAVLATVGYWAWPSRGRAGGGGAERSWAFVVMSTLTLLGVVVAVFVADDLSSTLPQLSRAADRFQLWLDPFWASAAEWNQRARWIATGVFEREAWVANLQSDLALIAVSQAYGRLAAVAILVPYAFLAIILFLSGDELIARGEAMNSRRPQKRQLPIEAGLFAVFVSALLTAQVFVHVASCFAILPPTGVPLPWVSNGGSAALTFSVLLFAACGRCLKQLGRGRA